MVRIKIMELLYDLAQIDQNLLLQLIQLRKQAVADLSHVIEENYMNPLQLEEFAYLSGRSLASLMRATRGQLSNFFATDLEKIYQFAKRYSFGI